MIIMKIIWNSWFYIRYCSV